MTLNIHVQGHSEVSKLCLHNFTSITCLPWQEKIGAGMMIPMILRLKVKSDDASFGFFFPMLLLYILMVPAFIITGIVYALMMLAPEQTRLPRSFMMMFFKTPTLLSAARGIKIDVHSNDADIKMYLK